MFLYCTVSTLNPIVGIVVTTSPICNRYNIVVFPLSLQVLVSERERGREGGDQRRVEPEHEYSYFCLPREES